MKLSLKVQIYFVLMLLGCLWVGHQVEARNLEIASVAWFFWSASFLFLPLWAALAGFEYFFVYLKKEAKSSTNGSSEKKSGDSSGVGTPARFLVMTVLTVFMVGMFHLIVGLFMSIVLPVQPFELFKIEGYNKNFNLELITFHLEKFDFLIPGFLILKSTLLLVEPGLRLRGHGCIRDGIFPLIAGALVIFGLQNPNPYVFSAVLFLPWTVIFGRDRFDKISTRQPELQVPLSLPVEYTYRPQVSWFWGLVFLLAGLGIASFCVGMAFKLSNAPLVATLLMALIGIMVGSGFIFAGMNMLFAVRNIKLTQREVSVRERAFLVILPRIKQWSCDLNDYSRVQVSKHKGVSSSGSFYFTVQLMHKSESSRNIELYRAFFSDDYLKVADQWKELLQLP